MIKTKTERTEEKIMNEKLYGVLATHDHEIEIHRADCKDFVKPKNKSKSNIGDFACLEVLALPINPENNEDLKKVLVTISDSFWGAEGLLNESIIIMKCTDTHNLNRKVRVNLDFNWVDDYYDCVNDSNIKKFKNYIVSDWKAEHIMKDGEETWIYYGWKNEFQRENPPHRHAVRHF